MSDGKLYEELVYRYLLLDSYSFDNDNCEPILIYNLEKDVTIRDMRTSQSRQIDLLITPPDKSRLFIVECKDWSKPVDSPEVESFIQKCENLHANQCYMFSSSGFTQGSDQLGKKSRGLDLITKRLSDLMYLLDSTYEYDRLCFKCPQCNHTNGFFGPNDGLIFFNEIMHIVSNRGKYLKNYWGVCSCCLNKFVYTPKTNIILPVYEFVGGVENSYIPISKKIISNSGNNKIVYEINEFGNIESINFNGSPCEIISHYFY